MAHPILTRRQALVAASALPLSGALAGRASAEADMMGPTRTDARRFRLGEFEVTALLAGTRTLDEPQGTFGMNVSPEEFAAASEPHFIPTDVSLNFFTPSVVNTGSELILFDTGLDPEGITAALTAAGYSPEQVDVIVLTHMHGDHIGGLGAGGAIFPNARIVAGRAEWDHWSAQGNEGFDNNVRPLADRTEFLEDGGSVASGITAMAAFGHTPGHMTFMLESEGEQLLLAADTANHFAWSVEHPDWEVRFDADKAQAAETRRRIFGMLASDRTPFLGYHMPFPAIGYVEARDDGTFRYVPTSYQLLLGSDDA
jgi:glyoxylase-like metal-dependent hydrolase (beta-lactamase superfamily II)